MLARLNLCQYHSIQTDYREPKCPVVSSVIDEFFCYSFVLFLVSLPPNFPLSPEVAGPTTPFLQTQLYAPRDLSRCHERVDYKRTQN
jgi:hypothetical protein